jgi:chromosome segregation protein
VDRALAEAEKAAMTADADWDHFTQKAALPRQQVQVQQGRKTNAERNLSAINERKTRINKELASLAERDSDTELEASASALSDAQGAVSSRKLSLDSLKQALYAIRGELDTERQQQDVLRRQLQALTGQRASLEALQLDSKEMASDDAVDAWLSAQAMTNSDPLVEAISVDEGFEVAADVILGHWLHGMQSDLGALDTAATVPPTGLTLIDAGATPRSSDPALLAHYIDVPRGLEYLISGVQVVDDWTAALNARS